MPASTPNDITYPTAGDYVKSGDFASALAEALKTLALTADQAIVKGVQAGIVPVLSGVVVPKPVPRGSDLLTLGPGWWYVRISESTNPDVGSSDSMINKPPNVGNSPFLMSKVISPFGHATITWYGYSGTSNGVYENHTGNSAHTSWVGWRRLDNENVSASGLAGVANMLRVQEFRDAIGPVVTNGRGAVALRFDHGLANFNAKQRALLEARGIKYSLALSARNFNAGENAGVTAAMVNNWVGAEVWNHGANQHQDQSSVAGLTDQIVKGLEELQAALPGKKIWGYAVPGTGGTGQGGFFGGATVEQFYNTLAGDLILTNHAVSSGSMPGTARRVIDGRVRQGQAHFTIEAQTVARIKTEIDYAVSNRVGVQLMMHPSLMDTAGYLTTAQFTEVLDYIVAKRDSGELAVLSPYEMMVAEAQPEKAFIARNVRSLWVKSGTEGRVELTRSGNTVHLNVYGAPCTLAQLTQITLPVGFRPISSLLQGDAWYGQSSTTERVIVGANGTVQALGLDTEGATIYGTLSWLTREPWPTALPGTPL